MGQQHLTTGPDASTRAGRLGGRLCLRKGCGRWFQPRRWNQRYCQEPECLREVKRWQAAKRQRQRRATPEGRQRHAVEERQRRKQASARAEPAESSGSAAGDACRDATAWSRSNKNLPQVFCDRPGCYEPPRGSSRAPSRYCGDTCRSAMHRVRDRERKYWTRKTKAGRLKRRLEYQAVKVRRCRDPYAGRSFPLDPPLAQSGCPQGSVLGYGHHGDRCLGFSGSLEATTDDPQTSPGSRPRAPPAS